MKTATWILGVMLTASAWLGALACGGDDATPTPATIVHPTGPHDLVVDYAVGGGLVPPPGPLGDERLLLFGDGRLLVDRNGWQEARLTEDGIQRVLRVIVDETAFFDQPATYENNQCADCPTTMITVNATGRQKSVSAYALGIATPTANTDSYERLAALVRFFDNLSASTFRPGETASSGPYQPNGIWVRSYAIELYPPPPNGVKPWPAGLPALATLLDGGAICGAQAQSVRDLGTGQIAATDGSGTFVVQYRELFPSDPGAGTCGL